MSPPAGLGVDVGGGLGVGAGVGVGFCVGVGVQVGMGFDLPAACETGEGVWRVGVGFGDM